MNTQDELNKLIDEVVELSKKGKGMILLEQTACLTEEAALKSEMQKNMRSYVKSFDDSVKDDFETNAYIGIINEALYHKHAIEDYSKEDTEENPCEKSNITIISELFVPPKHRGKGIAIDLIKKVIKDADNNCQELHLETHPEKKEDFDRLVKFYESFGFTRDKRTGYMVRKAKECKILKR